MVLCCSNAFADPSKLLLDVLRGNVFVEKKLTDPNEVRTFFRITLLIEVHPDKLSLENETFLREAHIPQYSRESALTAAYLHADFQYKLYITLQDIFNGNIFVQQRVVNNREATRLYDKLCEKFQSDRLSDDDIKFLSDNEVLFNRLYGETTARPEASPPIRPAARPDVRPEVSSDSRGSAGAGSAASAKACTICHKTGGELFEMKVAFAGTIYYHNSCLHDKYAGVNMYETFDPGCSGR